MKYKVGDIVKVREDLIKGAVYCCEGENNGCGFISPMERFMGQKVKIVGCYGTFYKIDGDSYNWTDEMFESTPKLLLKTGYVLTDDKHTEWIVILDFNSKYRTTDILYSPEKKEWDYLENYNDNLETEFRKIIKIEEAVSAYNIVDLDEHKYDRTLIWEREQVREMTMAEIEELVGCKVKIVK